jgi:photosystem II stability/assembly factor-like uncharacterized protein
MMLKRIILIWLGILLATLACRLGQEKAATPEQATATLPALPHIEVTATATLLPTVIPPTITPSPAPPVVTATPTLPVVSAPALQFFDMLDANNGWGLTQNEVLRTLDGGATWYDVSIPEVSEVANAAHFFMDAKTAWISLPKADYSSGIVYRTSDGGLTWQQSEVAFPQIRQQFLDAQHGVALADLGAGAGSQAVAVLQTNDGGQTWTEVFNNDPTRSGSSDSLPLSGIKTGMTFLDMQHGWVGGEQPQDGYVWLFATSDGGRSWTHQPLELPPGMETAMTFVDPPYFFNSQEGGLAMNLFTNDGSYKVLYFTQDGGRTWKPTAPLANGQTYTWSPKGDALVWAGSAVYRNILFNGEHTWVQLIGTFPTGASPIILDLVDNTGKGWALVSFDTGAGNQLLKTEDGGITWTVLVP